MATKLLPIVWRSLDMNCYHQKSKCKWESKVWEVWSLAHLHLRSILLVVSSDLQLTVAVPFDSPLDWQRLQLLRPVQLRQRQWLLTPGRGSRYPLKLHRKVNSAVWRMERVCCNKKWEAEQKAEYSWNKRGIPKLATNHWGKKVIRNPNFIRPQADVLCWVIQLTI